MAEYSLPKKGVMPTPEGDGLDGKMRSKGESRAQYKESKMQAPGGNPEMMAMMKQQPSGDAGLAKMLAGMGDEELSALGLAQPQQGTDPIMMLVEAVKQDPNLLQQLNQMLNAQVGKGVDAVGRGAKAVGDWATKYDPPVRPANKAKPATTRPPVAGERSFEKSTNKPR